MEEKEFKEWLLWRVKYFLKAVKFLWFLMPFSVLLIVGNSTSQFSLGIVGLVVCIAFILYRILDKKYPDDRERKL